MMGVVKHMSSPIYAFTSALILITRSGLRLQYSAHEIWLVIESYIEYLSLFAKV